MRASLFMNNFKILTPAIVVILIVGMTVTYTAQAAIPNTLYDSVVFAESDVAETQPERRSVSIKKAPKEPESSKAAAVSVASVDLENCADGRYTGVGYGYAGYIKVEVAIKSHVIKSIKIIEIEADDPPYVEKAKKVIGYILKAQSLKVDTVSGATLSSNGIISAVADALNKAAGKASNKITKTNKNAAKESDDVLPDSELDDKKFRDGTYEGVGAGFNGNIHVSVTISGGSISKIEVTSHTEDQPYMDDAMRLIDLIVLTQSVNVDAVTGATYSSNGIINAVRDALKKAVVAEAPELDGPGPAADEPGPADGGPAGGGEAGPDLDEGYIPTYGMYMDGTYVGYAMGYKSLFTATVIVLDGNITSVSIDQKDDEMYYKLCEGIIDRIVKRQTTDGIDTVTGSTYSSKAILDAVNMALAKAKKTEMPEGREEEEDGDGGGGDAGGGSKNTSDGADGGDSQNIGGDDSDETE